MQLSVAFVVALRLQSKVTAVGVVSVNVTDTELEPFRLVRTNSWRSKNS